MNPPVGIRARLLGHGRFLLPFLLLGVALVSVAVMSCAPRTAWAQTPVLTLSDFDQTGLEMELLALVQAGEDSDWYLKGRFGDTGTLLDGELGIGPDNNALIRIRKNGTGNTILLNHDTAQPFSFRDFFGAGGDGRDLTLYIQTSATEVVELPVADTVGAGGGGYINFNVPGASQVPINAITADGRFIIAFARPASNTAPTFANDDYTRSVSETAPIGTNVGPPIVAADPDNDALIYQLSGTSGVADFAVSDTGQITVAQALDYDTTTSYELTITATDPDTLSDSATVTINVLANIPPVFSTETATRAVDENAASATDVGAPVTASDADAGDTITYSISGSPLFSIVETTGQIRVAANAQVNYEADDSHTVTATATDAEGDTDTISVTINVNDLDDAPILAPDPSRATTHGGSTVQFTVSLPANGHPAQNVTVSSTDVTGTMRLQATESGLTCDITTTTLTVAVGGTFYARFCDFGVATLSVAPTGSAVDGREYGVNITDPATKPAAPVGLSAVAGPNGGEVTLAWTAPDDGGADITGYEYSVFYPGISATGVWTATGSTATLHVVTGLTNYGINHQFWVRAVNRVGEGASSAASNQVRPGTIAGAPTGLSATRGDARVTLSWTAGAANGGTLSRYEYSSDDGASWRSTGGTSTTYTATLLSSSSASNLVNLVNGTEYAFRVRAVNQYGISSASGSVAATPATLPAAVTNLSATHGNAEVSLTWTAPDDGGDDITSYDYTTDGGTTWRTTGGTAIPYVVTLTSAATPARLVNGTEYSFAVRAVNDVGAAASSNVVAATPRTIPAAPTGLAAAPRDGEVVLTWVAPDDGGADIERYEYSTDGGTTWRTTTGKATTGYTVTQTSAATPANLVNDTEYRFAVRAVNSEGNGAPSAVVTATPTEDTFPPDQVTGLSAVAGNGKVTLSWNVPGDGGEPITRYDYSTDGGNSWRSTGGTTIPYVVTRTSAATPVNLVNGTTYSFRIRAVNSVGNGTPSAALAATPRAPRVPAAPTSFTATAGITLGGFDEVVLSWTAPVVGDDETITDYEYSSDDGATWRSTGSISTSYNATQTSAASPTDFILGRSYIFRVRAVNGAGRGAQSAPRAATPYGVPGVPGSLRGTAGNAQVTLRWTAAPAHGRNILRYDYSSDGGTTWRSTGGTSTTYVATQTSAATPVNLVNGTAYIFRVRGVNSVGEGPRSNSVTITPTNSTVPGQITGLTATPGHRSMTLSWTTPSDGGSEITGYDYTTDGGINWRATGTTASSYLVTQTSGLLPSALVNGLDYTFRVRARNVLGPGLQSAAVRASPANQPPAFAGNSVSLAVNENVAIGSNVGSAVAATDPDGDTVTYSLSGTNSAHFTVTGSGQIQTARAMDHESIDNYDLTLRALGYGRQRYDLGLHQRRRPAGGTGLRLDESDQDRA